jgi:hypothetical protein
MKMMVNALIMEEYAPVTCESASLTLNDAISQKAAILSS